MRAWVVAGTVALGVLATTGRAEAQARRGWGFYGAVSGGYGISLAAGSGNGVIVAGFDHGGMVHAALGAGTGIGRSSEVAIAYDFQAFVNKDSIIHNHTIGVVWMPGMFMLRTGIGGAVWNVFGTDFVAGGLGVTTAFGGAFPVGKGVRIVLEVPVTANLFFKNSSLLENASLGLQLGVSYL